MTAVPLLWRPSAAAPNPGLEDHVRIAGLALMLGVVWALLLGGAAVVAWRRKT